MEEGRFVDVSARVVEDGRGRLHRGFETQRVHVHAVAAAELAIPLAAKRRARIDEGEVDVEEDGACHVVALPEAASRGAAATVPAASGHGPAMARAARSESSTRLAATCAWSRVTESSRPGSRRS